ncbi:LLM class F420-dependent oxidoreductase [Streptomyces griseofuscus]|uniref:LLM class F420-dependent oxidoreductase n=1 Tax=Streptomyces TaxID=1883 RepID=UPI00081EE0E1|nr:MULTISPECIES: LLM class F420-dependent oxidoreductase [unclassified Streptomyces]MBJ7001378.1 LLM class F420-dependent oxidoreductase [Streptomyces sp. CRPSP2-6A1]MYQ91231.1 TIGR03620 family F420-dependent LLM class oxidoreductase [Streptomyces sp. SID4946]SCF66015.1 probable F420-dependent oxidoreductase, MSMEG_4141 family [Streptomyces sp. DconLS]SCF80396.1 probable F420-dependent oxidoreductase, MSMEG_4141 family [Streptomyces sp. LamerLS-31b]
MSQSTGTLKQRLGRHGVWDVALRAEDPARRGEQEDAAAELEELDFGAIWLGGNSTAANATPLIEATHHITVGTSIQSVWQQDAATTAADFARLESSHPGRFLLGLGVSHGPRVEGYHRPYSAMVDYLDALDKAGVPAGRRVLAALGPKMLNLAGDRAAGAIPYLVTPEHTAKAREILGQGPLLAPEFKVVLEQNPTRAREIARAYLARYLELPNYTNNFLRLGFDESDVADGGSDRLIDAVFAWGDDDRIRRRVHAFHEAGADHVALQVVTEETGHTIPREQWRRLALLLR